jgi:iron-sulfur cluster repair protein YtfE (RIC family)
MTALKRAAELQPYSRDHHLALLLCWKINTGFKKGIALSRIRKYAEWFYENHLLPHFDMEEQSVFPILGIEHPLIQQALADHNKLTKLFSFVPGEEECLKQIETELEKHVRFEERILFEEVQKVATAAQMARIESTHSDSSFCENSDDPFWL